MGRAPIWKSIAETVTGEIAAGRYRPGDKLPTEAEFARRFAVHRHTVRRALSALSEAGLVSARQGAGVFVAHATTDYPLGQRVRLTRNLAQAGRTAERTTIALETRSADAAEAEALRLSDGDPVLVYEGVSFADGAPFSLFRSVFPQDRLPGLGAALQETGSVTAALAQVGVSDYLRISTRLTAQIATPVHARHLGLRPGAPVLRSVSVNADLAGMAVEFGRTWFAGDRVTLTLDHPQEPDTGSAAHDAA